MESNSARTHSDRSHVSVSRREHPYAGGFLLADTDLGDIAHFDKSKLANRWWFWSDRVVTEERADALDGSFVLIRGFWAGAWELGTSKSDAEYLLTQVETSLDAFHQALDLMSGRFVILLYRNRELVVYNDAIGSRTVYYSSGRRVIASHINLLRMYESAELVGRQFQPSELDWAADFTPWSGLYSLLPNYRLVVDTLQVERFYPRNENPFWDMERDEKYREIERIWKTTQERILGSKKAVAFSVSGGFDSRLVLAMAKEHWGSITGYTYGEPSKGKRNQGTYYRRTMLSDDRIVRQLIPSVGFESHTFIDVTKRPQLGNQLQELLEQNTYGWHGFHLVASYRDLFPGDGWLNVRGNAIELSRQPRPDTSFEDLVGRCQQDYPRSVEDRLRYLGYDRPLHGYNLQLLAYWEFRHGKWLGEINNELDAAFETWTPAGNRRVRDLMSAFPEHEQREGLIVRDLIDRNAPELNWPPTNSNRNLYREWRSFKVADSRFVERAEVVNREGRVQEITDFDNLLIPTDFIDSGAMLSVRLGSLPKQGTLSFRVQVEYENANARDYFDWELKINNEPRFKLDGSVSSLPVNISIDNVSPDDVISLHLTFKKKVKGRKSWSKATHMKLQNFDFYEKPSSGGKAVVRHDWPSTC